MTTPKRLALLIAVLPVLSATTADAWPWRHHPLPPRRLESRLTSYRPHVVAPRSIHVHDGDTFYVGAEVIRLRGVDTPELGQPKSAAATRRLVQLLHSGPVTIVPRAEDVYGRTVADVYVGGRNVADVLRREGYQKPARHAGVRRLDPGMQ